MFCDDLPKGGFAAGREALRRELKERVTLGDERSACPTLTRHPPSNVGVSPSTRGSEKHSSPPSWLSRSAASSQRQPERHAGSDGPALCRGRNARPTSVPVWNTSFAAGLDARSIDGMESTSTARSAGTSGATSRTGRIDPVTMVSKMRPEFSPAVGKTPVRHSYRMIPSA